jgi:hypothetical protein
LIMERRHLFSNLQLKAHLNIMLYFEIGSDERIIEMSNGNIVADSGWFPHERLLKPNSYCLISDSETSTKLLKKIL